MEFEINNLFDQSILSEFLCRYQLPEDSATLIRKNNNFAYEIKNGSNDRILRIIHDRQKTYELLLGELHAVDFLKKRGLNVAHTIPSPAGNHIESLEINNGSSFHALLYEKADGEKYQLSDLTPKMLRYWGEITGKLHSAFQDYSLPTNDRKIRHRETEWHYEFLDPNKYLPKDKQWVVEKYQQNRSQIEAIPTTKENYIFIHNDLQPGNFIEKDDEPLLFDFDDSHINYIETDTAQALLLVLDTPSLYPFRNWSLSRDEAFELFCEHYWPAYCEQVNPSHLQFDLMNAFIYRRVAILYTNYYRSFDSSNFNEYVRRGINGFEDFLRNDTLVVSAAQIDRLKNLSH
jgi:Ser/Thr protein kinase RdoA (MazF antagonist)